MKYKIWIKRSGLLCFSFVVFFIIACKDNDEIPVAVLGKVKFVSITGNDISYTNYYEYNKNGKLTKVTFSWSNSSDSYEEFFPDLNRMYSKCYSNGYLYYRDSAYLNNSGYITSETIYDNNSTNNRFSFKYNSDGFLTEMYEDWEGSSDSTKYYHDVFEIEGGNVVKLYHPSDMIVKYEYYDNLINNGIYQIQTREMGGIVLYPGYYGRYSHNLLKYKIYTGFENDTLKYEYTFTQNKVQKEIIKTGNSIYQVSEFKYY